MKHLAGRAHHHAIADEDHVPALGWATLALIHLFGAA
jgi:hypothetical protein